MDLTLPMVTALAGGLIGALITAVANLSFNIWKEKRDWRRKKAERQAEAELENERIRRTDLKSAAVGIGRCAWPFARSYSSYISNEYPNRDDFRPEMHAIYEEIMPHVELFHISMPDTVEFLTVLVQLSNEIQNFSKLAYKIELSEGEDHELEADRERLAAERIEAMATANQNLRHTVTEYLAKAPQVNLELRRR